MANTTSLIPWAFDMILAIILVSVAWRLLVTPDLFKGIVLFIVFGLLMAIAWVRLQAPDIALAEAAIGSGLAGALFLSALGRMVPKGRKGKTMNSGEEQADDGATAGDQERQHFS